jgi:tRNA pseudouridine38-40 synthase
LTRDTTFEFMGSGRTDAGVHALRQVAHLDLRKPLPAETLRRGINDNLPADIHVLAVDSVPHRFHARHGAVARSYHYQVSRRRTAFAKPFVWWVKEPLDFERMQDAAGRFAGMHDFQAFSDDDPEEKSTDVLVDEVALAEVGDLVLIRVSGSHFIWKMVRRMVGVLVEVGRGTLPEKDIVKLLQAPAGPPRRGVEGVARYTAPPSGLFLENVLYEGETNTRPLVPAFPVPALQARGGRALS